MSIVQESFFIPVDIATGIATGKFRRVGGVVRVAQGKGKGQLVKFLDPVSSDKQASLLMICLIIMLFIRYYCIK